VPPPRRSAAGIREIGAALATGEAVAAVFVARGASAEPDVAALLARVRDAGASVHVTGPGVLRRFGRGDPPPGVVAVLGPSPRAGLDEVLARAGAVWLLAGLSYATNAGFAIRTAEVAGAAGVVVDAAFGAAGRRTALRASMRADRVMPVLWLPALDAVEAARRAGVRVVAVEESGAVAPWDTDLTRPSLYVVGNERRGIADGVLARCDEVVRVPAAGFIPSYNVHAALAAVATERLRQLGI
jgi:TrmH family RNA methyltransferase